MIDWQATGFAQRGRRLAETLGEFASLRYELIRLEAREERTRLVRLIVESMIATFAAFMAFLAFNVLVLILFPAYRVQILVGLVAFYGLLALWGGLSARARIKNAPAPFSSTVDELKKDGAMFGSGSS